MKIFSFISIIFLWGLIFLHAYNIDELHKKVSELEKIKLDKLTYTCGRVIAVLTPNGLSTSACAP